MAEDFKGLGNKRRIDLAAGVVMAVITAGGVFGMILPAWQKHEQAVALEAKVAAAKVGADKAADELKKMRAAYAKARQSVAKHPLKLAGRDELNERLSQVTALAATYKLEVDAIKPGGAKAGAHYVVQPIKLSGTGGFGAAVSFIHEMHRKLPDIGVRSLSLTADPSSAHQVATFQFDLNWYAAPAGS